MSRALTIILGILIVGCMNQKEKRSLQDFGPELLYHLENGDTLAAIQILENSIQDNPDNNEIAAHSI